MIFVGEGALLWRAVAHTHDSGHPVDAVYTTHSDSGPAPGLPMEALTYRVADINTMSSDVYSRCSDGLIWSINNSMIFRKPILDLGHRIYNVHAGPLPGYRGLATAIVAHAVLAGETELAATVHEVSEDIDAGAVVGEHRFPVAVEDTFEQVMFSMLRACHAGFVACLDDAVRRTLVPRHPAGTGGDYYGQRSIDAFARHREHPRYGLATSLGAFADAFADLRARWH